MSNQTQVVGNLAQDPELRYTPQGKAVVTFSVADTPRSFDKASGQWVNGETDWVRVVAWEGLAENIAASLRKGNQVIVTGSYRSRSYKDTKTEEQRTMRELHADQVGPSLQFATAVVEKSNRRGNNNGGGAPANNGGGYNNSGNQGGGYSAPSTGGSENYSDDTPF